MPLSTTSSTSSTARSSSTRSASRLTATPNASNASRKPETHPRMNLIGRLLPLNHVLLGLDASSKKRLFEQIGLLFENSRQIPRARVNLTRVLEEQADLLEEP